MVLCEEGVERSDSMPTISLCGQHDPVTLLIVTLVNLKASSEVDGHGGAEMVCTVGS